MKAGETVRVGVDTGGTFTDLIVLERGNIRIHKVLSTPSNPARAILQGFSELFGEENRPFLDITHGSTVATNTLLTREGAKTALITTSGFEDVIEIGRQNRKELYDLTYRRSPPLVSRQLRIGLKERLDERGDILIPISEEELPQIVDRLKKSGVESVAICFLHAYANPSHEEKVSKAIRDAGFFVSASSHVLPEYREYERASTTCVNAYVSPLMIRYLHELNQKLGHGSLRIMQSNGGVISGETAAREAVRTILSGPAGGVVGGFEVASAAGFRNVITFDMGGTSTDVSLIDETIGFTGETEVAGCPIRIPVIDIHTVGAGGGSIARCDPGGALEVGPESAGADPGPICYGRGTEVTVTDANLFLGRLDPDRFLGGRMRLQKQSVKKGIENLAASLNLSPIQTAEGVLRVADQHMARAIRLISVERGHDPREYVLVSFGGAGAMHACSLARILDIPTVLIPRDPGILSARGMVVADVVRDYAQTVLLPAEAANGTKLEHYFRPLLDRAKKDLRREGFSSIRAERFADMRYLGQSFEITVSIPKGGNFSGKLLSRFHEMHDSQFGISNPQRPVEVVTLRVRAVGKVKKPPLSRIGSGKKKSEARTGTHPIMFGGKVYKGAIYERDLLRRGNQIKGPALVVEFSSTTVIPPDLICKVDKWGNLLIDTILRSSKARTR